MSRYGGYDLQSGDRDPRTNRRGIYGGKTSSETMLLGDWCVAPDCESVHLNDVALPRYVHRLQTDLHTLGFTLVGAADGAFGRKTQWAVREFQIHAKMEHIAREAQPRADASPPPYLDRLTRATNSLRYDGPVSGVANEKTRQCLEHWLELRWRCPVVVQARTGPGHTQVADGGENIWLPSDMADTGPRMYARDFSGYYDLPPAHDAASPIVLGDYQFYPKKSKRYKGPRSKPPLHHWTEAEFMPEEVAGSPLGALNGASLSTFKVVRVVAERECYGHADSINAYDNAFMSVGPCHWTLGRLESGVVQPGEMCGLLAYLRSTEPAAFERAFGFFGLRPQYDWDETAIWSATQRKFEGWIKLQCETSENQEGYDAVPTTEEDADYFRLWHWAYRFIMAGRTLSRYRHRMWALARTRLRDIRAVPWPSSADVTVTDVATGTGGQTRRPTVGEVVTSEVATAILLRWHIRFSGHMINGEAPGVSLKQALKRAKDSNTHLDWNSAPTAWTDAHELALIEGFAHRAEAIGKDGLVSAIQYIRDWPERPPSSITYRLPDTIGALSADRNSFALDDTDLPAAR